MVEVPVRVVQTVGITTAGLLAGFSLSVSFYLVPRLLESPSTLLLKQWKHAFDEGKLVGPIGAIVSAGSFFLLAQNAYSHAPNVLPHQWRPYLISGLCAIGIMPYTLLVIQPTNKKLEAKVEETASLGVEDKIVEAGLGEETAHKLVDKWATLNLGRSVLLLASALLGTWTALGTEV